MSQKASSMGAFCACITLYIELSNNWTLAAGCPSSYLPAVGTLYDSWPKPGSHECVADSGCKYAGQFASKSLDTGSKGHCIHGAQELDGGCQPPCVDCRFPQSLVAKWSIASTVPNLPKGNNVFGNKIEILAAGFAHRTVQVNMKDTCHDADCDGCCSHNSANHKYVLIDIEKWPASKLLDFDPNTVHDLDKVKLPKQDVGRLRPGADANAVIALCYKIIGPADPLVQSMVMAEE